MSRTAVDALWVVAMVAELAPLVSMLERPRLLSTRLAVGRVGPQAVGLLRCGVGPERAARRTWDALQKVRPGRVLSVGSCGALVDGLSVGAAVTASVVTGPGGETYAVTPVEGLPVLSLVTVKEPVWTASVRSRLASSGHGVCEMEAAGVVRAVAGVVPVSVLKVVSDHAGGVVDPALDLRGGAPAVARFMARVEGLMRAEVVPLLVGAATRPP